MMTREDHQKRRRALSRLAMNPRLRPDPVAEQAFVDAWNAEHQVGVAVRVLLDSGEVKETKTTTPAQVLGGHTAVVWLEGVSGCYRLSRCAALP